MKPVEKKAIADLNEARENSGGTPFHPRYAGQIAQTYGARGFRGRMRFFKKWAEAYRLAAPIIEALESNADEADAEFQREYPLGTPEQYVKWLQELHDE